MNCSNALVGLVMAVALTPAAGAAAPEGVIGARIELLGAAANYLEAIEVVDEDGRRLESETTVERRAGDVIRMNLGLGESVAKRITLIPARGSSAEFRIEQQHQTSLTVMNEGPHMDLRDWRHHLSVWKPIERSGSLVFVSREPSSEEFPRVTTGQIVAAVEAESRNWATAGYAEGDRWVRLAKQCTGATTYPCGVSVSEVRLRIRVKERGSWKTIQTVELVIPMGC